MLVHVCETTKYVLFNPHSNTSNISSAGDIYTMCMCAYAWRATAYVYISTRVCGYWIIYVWTHEWNNVNAVHHVHSRSFQMWHWTIVLLLTIITLWYRIESDQLPQHQQPHCQLIYYTEGKQTYKLMKIQYQYPLNCLFTRKIRT